jgi:L-alanine-DL-glutamate epimerase-like enolase superfamily enzyme
MRITDVEVIEFKTTTHSRPSKWTYGIWGEEVQSTSTVTKVSTDEGVDGYMLGGNKATIEGIVRPMLLGEDPLARERLWGWMDQTVTFSRSLPESDMGVVDCALWDLMGRLVGLPVSKLLGGARDRVKAYASTHPNMGGPEVYAEHALACKKQGYKAYKVHAYICWDPIKWEPAPQLPGFPREDVEVCKAVREAVGDDMVLMLDPFGVYTLEQALWVGRELEKLNYYWLEHPMIETRVEPYRRLTRELDIAICSPEHVPGGVFSRAEWILQGASDMLRIDYFYGGLTGCWKLINVCQAYGLQCELHGGGWPHMQLACAVPEATCEYYERGLLRPGLDDSLPEPYLTAIPDPMDGDGNVILSDKPGLGFELNWDYIDENRINI